jgi:hypothetical protein
MIDVIGDNIVPPLRDDPGPSTVTGTHDGFFNWEIRIVQKDPQTAQVELRTRQPTFVPTDRMWSAVVECTKSQKKATN